MLSPEQLPIPESFVCPITQEVMTDPVCTVDGHTYERSAITEWLRVRRTSPKTNLVLPSIQLTPNHSLRSAIETWREQRPEVKIVQLSQQDLEMAVSIQQYVFYGIISHFHSLEF
jgi:hypothetical protein